MKVALAAILAVSCGFAGTVQGVIFDDETQIPIARTHVTLMPLPGTTAPNASLLANEHGQYAFTDVPPGWYIIRAARIGYETAEYGQLHAGLPGIPVEVTNQPARNDGSDLHQFVMRRQAAIVGSVVDDNVIGIPEWPVSVYTAKLPIRRIAQTKTDDRGNFRVGELEPGDYIVRSGGGGLEDATTLVPAYYKYGTALAGAEPVRVHLAETQAYIVIHTVEGQLFELSGEVTAPDKRPVSLSLITDTGRRLIASATGPFVAAAVPPGNVELLAEGPGCASYQTMLLDRNMFARVDCQPYTSPVIDGALDYPLIARRLDLDGPGEEIALGSRRSLSPGHWEFQVRPTAAHYLVSVMNDGDTAPPSPLDGWYGLTIGNAPRLRVTLSAKPASISGMVASGAKPVTGAPVFLQLLNPATPELPLQTWSIRADPQGHFTFSSLGPGAYRVMSSYDVDFADPLARDKAVGVTLREGDAVIQQLEMIRQ